MKAILLISHGSRSPQSCRENIRLVTLLKKKSRLKIVEYAFLDVETPTIREGIQACVSKGATRVVILLNFLNSGNHVLKDIPALIRQVKKQHPNVSFKITPPIGIHPGMADLFLEWAEKSKVSSSRSPKSVGESVRRIRQRSVAERRGSTIYSIPDKRFRG